MQPCNHAGLWSARQSYLPCKAPTHAVIQVNYPLKEDRCGYVICRGQYDANMLSEAKQTLQRAAHCSPWDSTLAFNLAVVMQVSSLPSCLAYGPRALTKAS